MLCLVTHARKSAGDHVTENRRRTMTKRIKLGAERLERRRRTPGKRNLRICRIASLGTHLTEKERNAQSEEPRIKPDQSLCIIAAVVEPLGEAYVIHWI